MLLRSIKYASCIHDNIIVQSCIVTNILQEVIRLKYTVGHKKRAPKLLSITLAIINRF